MRNREGSQCSDEADNDDRRKSQVLSRDDAPGRNSPCEEEGQERSVIDVCDSEGRDSSQ
jgi:hypothetical protein